MATGSAPIWSPARIDDSALSGMVTPPVANAATPPLANAVTSLTRARPKRSATVARMFSARPRRQSFASGM